MYYCLIYTLIINDALLFFLSYIRHWLPVDQYVFFSVTLQTRLALLQIFLSSNDFKSIFFLLNFTNCLERSFIPIWPATNFLLDYQLYKTSLLFLF